MHLSLVVAAAIAAPSKFFQCAKEEGREREDERTAAAPPIEGGRSYMTFAKIWDFWTPSLLVTVPLMQPISTVV